MTYKVVNRWVDILILNCMNEMPSNLANESQQYHDITCDNDGAEFRIFPFAQG